MDSKLVERYIPFIKDLANKYNYNSNITHLLYLIIPAFISKYSLSKEKLILNTFDKTRIIISSKQDKNIQAYYTSIPSYQENKITTTKYIVIQNYEKISLIQLLDNLVHEFNHAINSYNEEIKIKDNNLYLRTGLTYTSYSLQNNNIIPLKKDSSYILEEILNTNQTEQIINIIKNYHDTTNPEIANTIYAINNETNSTYTSKSYYLENLLFQKILENKTFLSTLNNLRLTGDIDDIEQWFNNITNITNSYQKLNHYLENIMNLEKKLSTTIFFKSRLISKIKTNIHNILIIINIFNQNCNYK